MSILEESKPDFPSGITSFHITLRFFDASINKVIYTLIEAFLRFLGRLFILQDFVYFNSGIAVPVAIIGTFFFLQIFGSRSTC
jgi:HAE1 family hydrophobic/amphiphilic exporter-1